MQIIKNNLFLILLLSLISRFAVAIYFSSDFNLNNLIGADSISIHGYADFFSKNIEAGNLGFEIFYKDYRYFESDNLNFVEKNFYIPSDLRIRLFTVFLGFLYYLFGNNVIIGCTISIFFWLLSALVFIKICNLLNFKKQNLLYIVFIYSFLPSSLIFCSIVLRESYQLFFINLTFLLYFFYLYKKKYIFLFLSIIPLIFLILLHEVYLIYSLIFVLYIIFTEIKKSFFYKKKKKYFYIFIIFLLIIIFNFLFQNFFLVENFILEKIYLKLYGINISRSAYISREFIDFHNFFSYFLYVIFSFFKYMFSPYFFSFNNLKDLVIFGENLLRIYFFITLLYYISIKNIKFHFNFIFFCFFYILLEIFWSLGTVNWGTALRHHLPSIGLLLINISLISIEIRKYKSNKI